MSDICQRLTDVREILGRNQSNFAAELDIKRPTLAGYEKGVFPPSAEFLVKIREIYDVNIDWLLTGEGTPFIKQGIGTSAGYAPPGTVGIGAGANTNPNSHLPVAQSGIKIPLLKQSVSCGSGIDWEAEENIEEYIEAEMIIPRLGIGRVFAVKAQGSSMLGAGIKSGDYIFFDASEEQALRDGIYVFALDGDVYCKRLEFDKLARKIKIFSVRVADLEKAELITALDTNDSEYAERFRIFGRVTRCIRLIDVETK